MYLEVISKPGRKRTQKGKYRYSGVAAGGDPIMTVLWGEFGEGNSQINSKNWCISKLMGTHLYCRMQCTLNSLPSVWLFPLRHLWVPLNPFWVSCEFPLRSLKSQWVSYAFPFSFLCDPRELPMSFLCVPSELPVGFLCVPCRFSMARLSELIKNSLCFIIICDFPLQFDPIV